MSPGSLPAPPRDLPALAAAGAAEAASGMARFTGCDVTVEGTDWLAGPARAVLPAAGPAGELVAVAMDLIEPLGGTLLLFVDSDHAEQVTSRLVPGAAAGSLDAEGESAILEMANIAGSAFVSSIARRLGGSLLHGVPRLARGTLARCLDALAARTDGPVFAARMACDGSMGMLVFLPDPRRIEAEAGEGGVR